MTLIDLILGRRRNGIDDAVWRRVVDAIPMLRGLDPEAGARLRSLADDFLAEKQIELAQGAEVDDFLLTGLAAQACLPIMNLGAGGYRDWHTLILYPAEFVAPRHEVDEAGVHHEWQEEVSGEAWEDGPVILSLADVGASGLCDGYNVIVHEMAHKLDLLDGDANGYPPLHRDMDATAWHEAFTQAYAALQEQLRRGRVPAVDAYAATDPAEFFAVVSEYFFELPAVLAAAYPAVYTQLAAFYRQDPGARLESDWQGPQP